MDGFGNIDLTRSDEDPPRFLHHGGYGGDGGGGGVTRDGTGGPYTTVPMSAGGAPTTPTPGHVASSGGDHSSTRSGISMMECVNMVGLIIILIIFVVYASVNNTELSPPAVMRDNAALNPVDRAADGSPPPPLPPPAPPPHPPPHEDSGGEALIAPRPPLSPPPPPPQPPHDATAFDFLFRFSAGRPLELPAVAADSGGVAERPAGLRARTFYLLESDGASSGAIRAMDRLQPEDLASYQCCCYDQHVSVCHSPSHDLLPGYELACLLLYDSDGRETPPYGTDHSDRSTGDEAWTLVVTLGDRYEHGAYCRLAITPLDVTRRPDRHVNQKLFAPPPPRRTHERRALEPERDPELPSEPSEESA